MATYIDRETYRNRLADLESWCQDERKPGLKQALEMFDEVPAADVASVVHGRWIPTEHPFMNECEDCSNCGYRTVYGNDYPYCPNCGAKMDGGDHNEAD